MVIEVRYNNREAIVAAYTGSKNMVAEGETTTESGSSGGTVADREREEDRIT